MSAPWIAACFALFAWWFSTGAILLVVRRTDTSGTHRAIAICSLPLLLLGAVLAAQSLQGTEVGQVYVGFLGALCIWGWIELTFLLGAITGPLRAEALPGQTGAARFRRALTTLAYHEALLLISLLALLILSVGAPNRMALTTFLVLYLARICAKLNLHFGVPRINTEFIPAKLSFLRSYFRQGPVTLAFPISITVLTALLAACAQNLWQAETDTRAVGFALLTTLTTLALLEHWLMVVPLPDAKLWRWMLPAPHDNTSSRKTL